MTEQNKPKTPEGGKTFTQEELEQIIGERLARERMKFEDYEDLKAKADKFDEIEENSKTELQKAQESANSYKAELEKLKKENTVRDMRSKVAKEKRIPENLLTGNNEEDCLSQAKAILDFAKGSGSAPIIPDGGEPHNPPSGKTRDQFADWIEQELN